MQRYMPVFAPDIWSYKSDIRVYRCILSSHNKDSVCRNKFRLFLAQCENNKTGGLNRKGNEEMKRERVDSGNEKKGGNGREREKW